MHKCKVLYNNLYALQSCVLEFDLKNIFNNTFNRYTFSKRHTSRVVRKEVDRTFIERVGSSLNCHLRHNTQRHNAKRIKTINYKYILLHK